MAQDEGKDLSIKRVPKKVMLAVWVLSLFLAACAAPAAVEKKGPSLFWPQPPDPPKIAYLQELAEPKDVGVKPSFFKRALEFLFGKEAPPHVIRPSGIAVDHEGGVYIADTGLQAVHHFDLNLKTYKQYFGVARNQRLQNPIGVAIDRSKQLYVSDADLNRIFVFDQKRRIVRVIGGDDAISRVAGIAIDPERERLYAVDTTGHQVVVYTLSGEKKGVIGKRGIGKGEFNFPTYAAVDSEGRLYVSDSLNFRIQVFDPAGAVQTEIGSLGDKLGQFSRPKGLAVDRSNNLFVVDTLYDNVQIFNESGELLLHFGRSGMAPGFFWLPAGIAVDRQGRIYVADSYNQRVQVFQLLDGTEPSAAAALPATDQGKEERSLIH